MSTPFGRRKRRKEQRYSVGGRWLFGLTATTLIAALVLGGATSRLSWMDAAVQLVSVPLLGCALWHLRTARIEPHGWAAVLLAGAALALPALQLLTLPPEFWGALPGRDFLSLSYAEAGVPLPWLPVTLDAHSTRAMAVSLVPAIAVFLATLTLGYPARRTLSVVLVLFALGSVLLVLAQTQLGQERTFGFHPSGYQGVGLFANRNHLAALLYTMMPIAAAWAVGLLVDRPADGRLGAMLFMFAYACLLLGIGMARSRAGLTLAGCAGITSLLLAWAASQRRELARPASLVVAGTVVGVVLVLNFALLGIVERLDTDLSEDYRFTIAQFGAEAARDFFPVGSGLGTFTPVYRIYEPVLALKTVYANNAHNDWLELLIEGGIAAAVLMASGVIWWALALRRCWAAVPRFRSALDVTLQRAGTVILGLLFLHSIIDYPLRTTSLMVTFGFVAGLLVDAPRAAAESPFEKGVSG